MVLSSTPGKSSADKEKKEEARKEWEKLRQQLRQSSNGATHAAVLEMLGNMCREEEGIRNRTDYKKKKETKKEEVSEKVSFWRRRFVRRSPQMMRGRAKVGGADEEEKEDSDTNMITKFAKQKYKPKPKKPTLTFSENVQDMLLNITSQFEQQINSAFKSDPATKEEREEDIPLSELADVTQIDVNMRAIDKDMKILDKAKQSGVRVDLDDFRGVGKLGDQDYLSSSESSSSEEDSDEEWDSEDSDESGSEAEAGEESSDEESEDDDDSDEESDDSDDDDDSDEESSEEDSDDDDDDDESDESWTTDDESSLESYDELMAEMQTEMGIIMPDKFGDSESDVSCVEQNNFMAGKLVKRPSIMSRNSKISRSSRRSQSSGLLRMRNGLRRHHQSGSVKMTSSVSSTAKSSLASGSRRSRRRRRVVVKLGSQSSSELLAPPTSIEPISILEIGDGPKIEFFKDRLPTTPYRAHRSWIRPALAKTAFKERQLKLNLPNNNPRPTRKRSKKKRKKSEKTKVGVKEVILKVFGGQAESRESDSSEDSDEFDYQYCLKTSEDDDPYNNAESASTGDDNRADADDDAPPFQATDYSAMDALAAGYGLAPGVWIPPSVFNNPSETGTRKKTAGRAAEPDENLLVSFSESRKPLELGDASCVEEDIVGRGEFLVSFSDVGQRSASSDPLGSLKSGGEGQIESNQGQVTDNNFQSQSALMTSFADVTRLSPRTEISDTAEEPRKSTRESIGNSTVSTDSEVSMESPFPPLGEGRPVRTEKLLSLKECLHHSSRTGFGNLASAKNSTGSLMSLQSQHSQATTVASTEQRSAATDQRSVSTAETGKSRSNKSKTLGALGSFLEDGSHRRRMSLADKSLATEQKSISTSATSASRRRRRGPSHMMECLETEIEKVSQRGFESGTEEDEARCRRGSRGSSTRSVASSAIANDDKQPKKEENIDHKKKTTNVFPKVSFTVDEERPQPRTTNGKKGRRKKKKSDENSIDTRRRRKMRISKLKKEEEFIQGLCYLAPTHGRHVGSTIVERS